MPPRLRPAPALALALAALLVATAAPARADYYAFDELSPRNYPQLQDCLMLVINDAGVAAGYVALDTPYGPYLPATHAFGGAFDPIPGLSSTSYFSTAVGISNTGTVVGRVGGSTPPSYLYANGTVTRLAPPTGFGNPSVVGISPGGVAYGTITDRSGAVFRSEVFTTTDGTLTIHPLEADGLTNFRAFDKTLMNDAGVLAVQGFTRGTFEPFGYYLYDTAGGGLTPVETPAGYDPNLQLAKLTPSSLFGSVFDAEFNTRYAYWNLDGTFREFFDPPGGGAWDSVRVNDLGQAVGFAGGQLWTYDGSTWEPSSFLGLNGASPFEIYDLNNQGQFVGGTFVPGSGFYWGFVATPAAVPEPASLSLLAAGGLGLLGYARRRAGRA